jgi:hypothetical protein
MPIMHGDEIVVALAGDGSQLNVTVLPLFFEAEYNDYGTFENPAEDTLAYRWFRNFVKGNGSVESLQEVVRDGIERELENINYPASYNVSGTRVIFVLKTVWENIIRYQADRCEGSFYYHNPKYTRKTDARQEIANALHRKIELENMQSRAKDDMSVEDQANLIRLMAESISVQLDSSINGNIVDHIHEYCKKYKIDCDDFIAPYSEIIEQSNQVSVFANATNSNLNSRYAGQDSNDEYFDVLIGEMQKRMMAVRCRWDEDDE